MESIFEKLLPKGVQVGEEVRRDGGLYIGGASLSNAVVSYLRQGPNVPLVQMSFVIGIQGRGTLNIPGSEYMDLLATMTAQAKQIAGLGHLNERVTSEQIRKLLAEELVKAGQDILAERVTNGDDSKVTEAAVAAMHRLVNAVPASAE